MRESMRYILVMVILFEGICGFAQTRRALLVTISEYPAHSGWSDIHADNDKGKSARAQTRTPLIDKSRGN